MKYHSVIELSVSVTHPFDKEEDLIITRNGMELVIHAVEKCLQELRTNSEQSYEMIHISETNRITR